MPKYLCHPYLELAERALRSPRRDDFSVTHASWLYRQHWISVGLIEPGESDRAYPPGQMPDRWVVTDTGLEPA